MCYKIPIARYRCERKGQQKITTHRTFSLLPHWLVPYHQHDLNIMLDTLNYHHQAPGCTFEQTKEFISSRGVNDDISLENYHIHHFSHLFDSAFYKQASTPEARQHIDRNNLAHDPVDFMLQEINNYQSPFQTTQAMNMSNIEKLAWDFLFNFQTGPLFNRHFLFGIPSQKR